MTILKYERSPRCDKAWDRENMRIYFDYPLATEENMKAVQDAIDSGKASDELFDLFDENTLWDCIVILSGNKDTPWALLDHMDGHEQNGIEDWQAEFIDEYIADLCHEGDRI